MPASRAVQSGSAGSGRVATEAAAATVTQAAHQGAAVGSGPGARAATTPLGGVVAGGAAQSLHGPGPRGPGALKVIRASAPGSSYVVGFVSGSGVHVPKRTLGG